jgi:hypothetical protein
MWNSTLRSMIESCIVSHDSSIKCSFASIKRYWLFEIRMSKTFASAVFIKHSAKLA